MTIYQNIETNETFTLESNGRYGYTETYDVTRPSEEEMQAWLKSNGFEFVGYENE